MKTEELKLFIDEGEGLTVEFKEKYSSKIDRDIVAFANSKGGYIFLGVTDNGKIAGETLSNKVKAEIGAIARNCDPNIEIKNIKQLERIVVVEVLEGEEKPYSCSSGYYRRLDAITPKMTQTEVRTMFRQTRDMVFEDLPRNECSLSDISLAKIKAFLKEAETSFKVNRTNVISFLSSLGVYKDKRINNAGILLFAAKIKQFIFHSETILAAFKGSEVTHIYDRQDVRDDLLTQLNESMAFLKKHLNVRSEIRELNRHDIYEIPLDAIREVLVNAIVHRDYSIKGTSMYVRVFDDRVEIENPGGLPLGLSKSQFGRTSFRRNPIVADLFHRMHKVERMGAGIKKINNLVKAAGLKEPLFEYDAFFRVTLYRNPEYALKAGGQKTAKKISHRRVPEKVTERVPEKVTENQTQILKELRKDPHMTSKNLAIVVGISERKIKSNIKKLKDMGLLQRIGPDRGGHWRAV
ncbi:MAG: putative DNA binding domain-containing protein [Candidatus Omnitrophica bacterium]|nr:putative DNA binding domain-containing protein [Candidatus Omnitrophota bacterium]